MGDLEATRNCIGRANVASSIDPCTHGKLREEVASPSCYSPTRPMLMSNKPNIAVTCFTKPCFIRPGFSLRLVPTVLREPRMYFRGNE